MRPYGFDPRRLFHEDEQKLNRRDEPPAYARRLSGDVVGLDFARQVEVARLGPR